MNSTPTPPHYSFGSSFTLGEQLRIRAALRPLDELLIAFGASVSEEYERDEVIWRIHRTDPFGHRIVAFNTILDVEIVGGSVPHLVKLIDRIAVTVRRFNRIDRPSRSCPSRSQNHDVQQRLAISPHTCCTGQHDRARRVPGTS